jgi:hypothetical protein
MKCNTPGCYTILSGSPAKYTYCRACRAKLEGSVTGRAPRTRAQVLETVGYIESRIKMLSSQLEDRKAELAEFPVEVCPKALRELQERSGLLHLIEKEVRNNLRPHEQRSAGQALLDFLQRTGVLRGARF